MSQDLERRNQTLDFLRSQSLLHIATLNNINHPEVASVFYYCYDDFRIIFSTRSHSRKFENLSQCEHVGFTVTNATDVVTVQGQGTAKITTNPVTIGKMVLHLAGVGIGSLLDLWPPPVHKITDGTFHVLEITPTWLRLGDFRNSQPDYFHQII